MAYIGVKNRTKDAQTLTHNGRNFLFAAGETRIIEGVPYEFIESRVHVRHATKEHADGRVEQLPHVVGQKLFEILPLEDALKVAKPEEDPRVVASRQAAAAETEKKRALFAEFKGMLIEEGWTPPSPEKDPADKKDRKDPAAAKSGAAK